MRLPNGLSGLEPGFFRFKIVASVIVLFIPLASVSAQNVVAPSTSSSLNDCPHLPTRDLWPKAKDQGHPELQQRKPDADTLDRSTASYFEAQRNFHPATLDLDVCFGSVELSRVSGSQLHVLITLADELPGGKRVGSYIETFHIDTGSLAYAFIKVPKKNKPKILVELPEPVDLFVNLGEGSIDVSGIQGNKTIRIARGELTIDNAAKAQYRDMRASFGDGRVIDDLRPDLSRHGQAFHWEDSGPGAYVFTAAFGSGLLRFLSSSPRPHSVR